MAAKKTTNGQKDQPALRGFRLVGTLGSTALKHNGAIRGVAYAPDGAYIASSGDGRELHLWDTQTGASLGSIEGSDRGTYSLCLSADGALAFVGGSELQVFDVAKKKRAFTLPVNKPLIVAIATSPSGVVLYGDDRKPRRFDIASKKELEPLKGHSSRVDACALNADGSLALTGGGDRKIKLHTVTKNKKKPEVIATLEGYAKSCGFAPDGKTAWSVGWDHAHVFDVSEGSKTFGKVVWSPSPKITGSVRRGAMSPDGKLFAIAYEEEVLVFAPATSNKPFKRLAIAEVDVLAFDHESKRLVCGSDGHGLGEGCGLEVFDVDAEKRVLPAGDGHSGGVTGLAAPAKRPNVLVSVGVDKKVILWDLESSQAVEQLGPLSEQGCAVDVTADAKTIVTTATDGRSLIWDVSTTSSRPLPTELEGRGSVAITLSADGKKVAWAPYLPGKAVVYDLTGRYDTEPLPPPRTTKKAKGSKKKAAKAEPKRRPGFDAPLTLDGHRAQMCAVDFAPEGKYVFTASADERVIAWHLPKGDIAFSLPCSGFVNAIAATGSHLITGTTNGEIAVFDHTTGKRERVLRSSGNEIHRLAAVTSSHVALVRAGDDESQDTSVIELWNVESKATKPEATCDLGPLNDSAPSLTASPDGARLYIGTNKGMIFVLERT